MQRWHVYEDWTLEEIPRCFYVGKGDDDRIKKIQRNRNHTDVVSLWGHDRRIVLTTESEVEALDVERRLIAERHTHPRDSDYNGIGCNRTRGGQGNSGRIVSDETRKKLSESKKGKTLNKVWTQEERDATSRRMSELHKGKKISEEQREVLRQRMQDPKIKTVMIEKVTSSIRKKYATDAEFRQRIIDTRSRGEHHEKSKVTEDEVRQMRSEWDVIDKTAKGGRWSGSSPAREFCQRWADFKGVSNQAIYAIVTRKTWKHVP